MKKIKVLAIVLTFSLLYKNQIFATYKNLEQTKTKELQIKKENRIKNNLTEKDKEKYNVKNYKIKQIVKRNGSKMVLYEHKKSGAQVLASYENVKDYTKNYIHMFFRDISNNKKDYCHVFKRLINEGLEIKIEENLHNKELQNFNFCDKYPYFINNIAFYEEGPGLLFQFRTSSSKFFKLCLEEIKNPKFFNNSKIFKSVIKRVDLNYNAYEEENKNYTIEDLINVNCRDRFCFGTNNISRDFNEDLNTFKKQYKKIINPSNCLMIVSAKNNNNFKKILKQADEEYFKYFEKDISKKQYNFKNSIVKEPFREFDLNQNNLISDSKYNIFENLDKDACKKCKYKARVFWDVSKLPIRERNVFVLDSISIFNLLKKEIENMGYCLVKTVLNEYWPNKSCESLTFDGLFYLDFYGSDIKYFKKEKLEENAKKIIKILYDKMQKMSDTELLEMYSNSCYNWPNEVENFKTKYKYNKNFYEYCFKSFVLTNNPLNEKYFDFDNNKSINHNEKEILKTYKKYLNRYELLFNNNPNYIDLYKLKPKNEKNLKKKYENYKLPFQFLDYSKNKNNNFKNKVLYNMCMSLVKKVFLIPNLVDKGLSSDILSNVDVSRIKEVENYLFVKFKKDVKNFKPTMEQFKKLKTQNIFSRESSLKNLPKEIKEFEETLKDEKKFKEYVNEKKEEKFYRNQLLSRRLNKIKKQIKDKEINEKSKKYKNEIKNIKKEIKEFEKIKNKPEILIDSCKKELEELIRIRKDMVNPLTKYLNIVKNITHEEFVNFFKKLKFNSSDHLKKYSNSKKKEVKIRKK